MIIETLRRAGAAASAPGADRGIAGEPAERVLVLAYRSGHFQTGLENVLDRATLEHQHLHGEVKVPDWRKVDELPSEQARKPAVRPFLFSGAAPSAAHRELIS